MSTFNIIEIPELASTNDYLKKQIDLNTQEEGLVILTPKQVQGRGQGSNSWESEAFKNLTFSLLLKPSFLPAGDMFMISKTISLALIDYLNSLGKEFLIKWPNDLYFGDKKIGGILIENQLLGCCLNYSMIGIGLNINQDIFMSNAPNPVSLQNIFKKSFDTRVCLAKILEKIQFFYEKLKHNQYDYINKEYHTALYRNKGYFGFTCQKEQFEARLISVENDGELKLETKTGELKSFYFKEVEFII